MPQLSAFDFGPAESHIAQMEAELAMRLRFGPPKRKRGPRRRKKVDKP
jgi:hypothetical protein